MDGESHSRTSLSLSWRLVCAMPDLVAALLFCGAANPGCSRLSAGSQQQAALGVDVQASHYLWAAAPIMAHQSSPIQPALGRYKSLQAVADFRAVEAPWIRNLASLCIHLVPLAPNTVDQEALQYVDSDLAAFLARLLDVVGVLVDLVSE